MNDTKNYTLIGMLVIVALIAMSHLYRQVFVVPVTFPLNKHFIINENESLKTISTRLHDEGYITSPLLFRAGISFFNKDRTIQLGEYVFATPLDLLEVVHTFANGRPTLPLLSVTVPEGSTSFEVASLVSKVLPASSVDKFNQLVLRYSANGKLFPSTYFLLPSYTEDDVIKVMLETFTKKVQEPLLRSQLPSPLTSINDVIVLASILEGEAKNEVDMKMVAGILLSRLEKGMPLQVDVAKETYKQKGLPSASINNPGLVAIQAVLHPTQSDNLYYLTDTTGLMHYAKTFEEHKRNIKKYLR